MKKYLILVSTLYIFVSCSLENRGGRNTAEEINVKDLKKAEGKLIGFYNVENLFDTIDDSYTIDEQFLPTSEMKWTSERYQKKLNDLGKVIAAFQTGDFPLFLGLAEVENKNVLLDLIATEVLMPANYGVVHYDSPDKRGIDVGFIYLKNYFKVLESRNIEVVLDDEDDFYTRDILYVEGLM